MMNSKGPKSYQALLQQCNAASTEMKYVRSQKFACPTQDMSGATPHIMIITLHDKKTLNAFHTGLTLEFGRALDAAAADPEVDVVVVAGGEDTRAFSAGGDVTMMGGVDARPLPPYDDKVFISNHFSSLITKVTSMPKPVIAAIHGVGAVGVAFTFVLACDLVIATSESTFRVGYPQIGLAPLGVAHQLTRLCGKHKAFELLTMRSAITAAEGRRLGFINVVVDGCDQSDVLAAARKVASDIASRAPKRALALALSPRRRIRGLLITWSMALLRRR